MASASFDFPEMRGRVCCQRVNSPATIGAETAWRAAARVSALAAHLCLELPQIGPPLHRGGGDPAVPGSVKFVEPPSAVGPASRQPRTVIAAALAQQLVAGSVAVHL